MWKGTFAPLVLATGPRAEKRKEREDDSEANRKSPKTVMQRLMRVDDRIGKFFDFKSDRSVDLMVSLRDYRLDELKKFTSNRDPFESVAEYLINSGYNSLFDDLAALFSPPLPEQVPNIMDEEYRRKNPVFGSWFRNANKIAGNSDFEAFFSLLTREPVLHMLERNVPNVSEFVVGMLALVLARFNATKSIKEIVEKLMDKNAPPGPFDDLIRPQLVSDIYIELSKQNDAFSVRRIASEVADIAKIRILSFLSGEDFIAFCKTDKYTQDKCESGIWKNVIAEIRFERQFGNDYEAIMALRELYYGEDTSRRTFQYAAIRAAKFANQTYKLSGNVLYEKFKARYVPSYGFSFNRADEKERASALEELPVYMYLMNAASPLAAQELFNKATASTFLEFPIDVYGNVFDGMDLVEKLLTKDDWMKSLLEIYSEKVIAKMLEKHRGRTFWIDALPQAREKIGDVRAEKLWPYYAEMFLRTDLTEDQRSDVQRDLYRSLGVDSEADIYKSFPDKRILMKWVRDVLSGNATVEQQSQFVNVFLQLVCDGALEADVVEQGVQFVVAFFVQDRKSSFIYYATNYLNLCRKKEVWIPVLMAVNTDIDDVDVAKFRLQWAEIALEILAGRGLERSEIEYLEKETTSILTSLWYDRRAIVRFANIYPSSDYWLPILREQFPDDSKKELVVEVIVKLDSKSSLPRDVAIFFARLVKRGKTLGYLVDWANKVLGLE